MDRNGKSTSDRWPSIDVSYQISFYLAKRFQRRRLKCEKLTDDGQQKLTKGPGQSVELLRNFGILGFYFSKWKYLGTINVCLMSEEVRKVRCRIAHVPLYMFAHRNHTLLIMDCTVFRGFFMIQHFVLQNSNRLFYVHKCKHK